VSFVKKCEAARKLAGAAKKQQREEMRSRNWAGSLEAGAVHSALGLWRLFMRVAEVDLDIFGQFTHALDCQLQEPLPSPMIKLLSQSVNAGKDLQPILSLPVDARNPNLLRRGPLWKVWRPDQRGNAHASPHEELVISWWPAHPCSTAHDGLLKVKQD
jgi:hypothetical protein